MLITGGGNRDPLRNSRRHSQRRSAHQTLGSNLFNVTLLAVYDVFDGPQNVWASMSNANALALVIVIMMTAVTIISLIYRASPMTPWRISWDGVALLVMYGASLWLLYALS